MSCGKTIPLLQISTNLLTSKPINLLLNLSEWGVDKKQKPPRSPQGYFVITFFSNIIKKNTERYWISFNSTAWNVLQIQAWTYAIVLNAICWSTNSKGKLLFCITRVDPTYVLTNVYFFLQQIFVSKNGLKKMLQFSWTSSQTTAYKRTPIEQKVSIKSL